MDQFRDSVHHAVDVPHDTNICGDLATFTFDVTSHTHMLDKGSTFLFDDHESFAYTLVFDDPALGTWTAHGAETEAGAVAVRTAEASSVGRPNPGRAPRYPPSAPL